MAGPSLSIIAALGQNRVIGLENQLPWSLPDDQEWFRRTTAGKPFIMGRNSYQSADAFLSTARNYILSRRTELELCENCILVSDLKSAIDQVMQVAKEEVFVIGGASVYKLALPQCDRLYLTMVEAAPEGDAFFPEVEWRDWREVQAEFHPADSRHQYAFWFRTYDRIS